jgi:hypothetical protein
MCCSSVGCEYSVNLFQMRSDGPVQLERAGAKTLSTSERVSHEIEKLMY